MEKLRELLFFFFFTFWFYTTLKSEKNTPGPDSPNTLAGVASLGWKAGRQQRRGWMEMPGTSPCKRFFGSVLFDKKKKRKEKKKERKLFIGLVPSVFLWNVIITQAALIYYIYRQLPEPQQLYYLSIFSQLNIWCKCLRTTTTAAWLKKPGLLVLNLPDQEGKGLGWTDRQWRRRKSDQDWTAK